MRRNFPTLALAAALALAAIPAAAQPRERDDDEPVYDRQDVRDAYRRGYERGFDRGYRKGAQEADRRPPPVSAPRPPPAPVLGPIKVIRAHYGTSSKNCDATRFVRRQGDGHRQHSFKVTNEMCGDPARGDRKTLEVAFWCGAVERHASAREHQTIFLNCLN